jgi:hypothetical protein
VKRRKSKDNREEAAKEKMKESRNEKIMFNHFVT